MIDLHMHILPEMDAGARDMEMALAMARQAVDCGTAVIAATPHKNIPGMTDYKWGDRYRMQMNELRKCIAKEHLPLTLIEGMEIFMTEDVHEKLNDGDLICLGNTRTPLIEFAFRTEGNAMARSLERLCREGYVPMLAHPERYMCVMEDPQLVFEWYQMGVIIQMNKGSILGRFGNRVRKTAAQLLRHRLIAVVASDAHGAFVRTPNMTELEYVLDGEYGPNCFELLLEINPARILEGKKVIWDDPVPFSSFF